MQSIFDHPQAADKPRYISHRGFQPLAPANSLPSFTYAGLFGQWAIETDVHLTRDDIPVCCHNDTVDETFDGCGAIRDMTWQELSGLRMNQGNRLACFSDSELRMPLFSEYLAICRRYGSIPFIELKTDDTKQILNAIHKAGFQDNEAVISSVRLERLKETRRHSRDIFIHWIFGDAEHMDELAGLGSCGMSWNDTDWAHFPKEKIDLCHKAGVKVCLRAGDSLAAVSHMLSLGLDYIPSNCMHGRLPE